MPFYYHLRRKIPDKHERSIVINKLLHLRKRLDIDVPAKNLDQDLLLATWNIRDFDKDNRRGFGERLPESLFYIAEILSRFDFVAVQEVNQLGEWETVMDILGPDFDWIATDVTDNSLGGNGERLTYLWDKRKVHFQNIAGEIVLPDKFLIDKKKQFRRTPFVASFQSGWFKFDICTVHIYYGEDTGPALGQRIQEIDVVAKYFGERADLGLKGDRALILLGDFNVISPQHETMKALLDNGFTVPKGLQTPTNVNETKYYDQIVFKTKPKVIEYAEEDGNAGVFKLFGSAFANGQVDDYKAAMAKASGLKKGKKYKGDFARFYKDWRTYQLSDHNPLWVRLSVNESEAYLKSLQEA